MNTMNGMNLGQGLNIRPSKPTDKPFLEQLHNATREDLRYMEGERDYVESIIQMQFRAQTEGYGSQFPNAMYFVVEKQQQPIGKVTLDFGPNEIRIMDIAFVPVARGKGFGEEVMRCLQNAAAQVGVPLTLSVLSTNTQAKKLYLKLGFSVQNITPPYEFMAWVPEARKIIV
ncbi:GNAT family N-acetyltransferase [Bowmanella denitrificans]|uniref:GNAT family N-acetyltransferase n=1 Tax=Bowmanella denitrificans TaxID=366582 RepID=UPI001FEB02A2|nr:GNAT family N-acetyltransferase [Bowmanella denitrificans]